MAPELIKKYEFDYEKVDVWALGIVMYVILVGRFPFKGASNREMYRKIIKGSYTIPDRVPIQAKRIIMKMLQIDPDHRWRLRNVQKGKQVLKWHKFNIEKWLYKDSDHDIMIKNKHHRQMLIQEHINYNNTNVMSVHQKANAQNEKANTNSSLNNVLWTISNSGISDGYKIPDISSLK